MGSTTMAFNKILVSVLLGCVAGQNSRTFPGFSLNEDISTTTPVPILKFIDQHNNDGSYTYGFQSADGTYKIETRLVTGEVKGKYDYIDVPQNNPAPQDSRRFSNFQPREQQGDVKLVNGRRAILKKRLRLKNENSVVA